MKRNYDTVAAIYDQCSRLVFGHVQVAAQLYLLPFIPAGARVLIAGGGTGWILEEIKKVHASGLDITYVDTSAKMIALARQRDAGGNRVTFITTGIEDVQADILFDVVLTPFLFDNFTQAGVSGALTVINAVLAANGTWLYCDFQDNGKTQYRLLLKVMYLFFGLLCGIEAKCLPDINTLANNWYLPVASQTFMNRFIVATVYKRR